MEDYHSFRFPYFSRKRPTGECKELVIQFGSVNKAKKEADKNQSRLLDEEIEQELRVINA